MTIVREMSDQSTARLIKVDKILGCLGLDSDEDIARFISFFIQKQSDKGDLLAATGESPSALEASQLLSEVSGMLIDMGDDFEPESQPAFHEQTSDYQVVPLAQFLERFSQFLSNQLSAESEESLAKKLSAPSTLANWNERDISKDSFYWQIVGNAIPKDKIKR